MLEDAEIRNLISEAKRDLQRETEQLRSDLQITRDDGKKTSEKLETTRDKLETHDRYFYVALALFTLVGLGAGVGANAVSGYREKVVTAFNAEKDKATKDFRASLPLLVGEVNPVGMIGAFLLKECPQGWVHYEEGAGRYLVGSWSSDTVGERRGKPLDVLENRATGAHTHTYVYATVGSNGADIGATQNGLARRQAQGQAGSPAGIPAGTNAPYVSRCCVKNRLRSRQHFRHL
ncbi:MAG: hypothetical protein JO212_09030 [Acetobacteraceae bacterium]|nr:hypothetical protein [Acetobacteraceae bacterium]